MSDGGYEARAYTAHLPMQAIAFIYRDGDPTFSGGIFRITRVRTTTAQDEKDFPLPPDGVCCLCGRDDDD